MTLARAPGKIVLSGAYAVLSGAPAIVTAVERDVVADTSRPADLVTDEVAAALRDGEQAPFFDASALRHEGRKLGLGSSAAILVASLFAIERERDPAAEARSVRQRVLSRGLEAHRRAQGGGSGIDVAASTFGGTLLYRIGEGPPDIQPVPLPSLCFEVWVCPSSASTPALIGKVKALAARAPDEHALVLDAQSRASVEAAEAVRRGDAQGLLAALRRQYRALSALGQSAGAPIVTADLAAVSPRAEASGGVLLPAGAGGGDIALYVAPDPSPEHLRRALESRAHRLLEARLEAPGASEL